LQSENFGTTWSPNQLIAFGSGSVLNTTGTLDPYGTNVSDLIVASTVSGVQHRIDQTTTSASGSYTFSVFVKAAGYNFTWLRIGTVGAFFNLSNGAITGTSAGIVASSQNYGNGWYRCIISKASSSANEVLRINIIQTDGVTDFAGDGTSGIYVFGAQYEVGSIATTYIPTTSGAVSRAADVISASGALVSGLIGQTEGTIYAEVDLRNWIASGRILTCSNGTSNERIIIQVGANRTLQAIVTTASADVVDISTASGQVNGVYKCALTYASGDFAFYVNGTQIGTDSSGGVPACTSVFLGKIGTSASTNFINDRIRAAAIYTTRLSNAQLAELTRL
jgi:molybdopterin-binding protein